MFRRIVNIVELLAAAGAVFFVVMLFAYRPGSTAGGNATVGAQLYTANCARCHGAAGEGGIGPQLAGSVVAKFADPQKGLLKLIGNVENGSLCVHNRALYHVRQLSNIAGP